MTATRPAPLSIPQTGSPVGSAITSTTGSRSHSPSSQSLSLAQEEIKAFSKSKHDGDSDVEEPSTSSAITSLPQFPASPKNASQHTRDHSKSFFSNLKASKSSHKVQTPQPSIRTVTDDQTEPSRRRPEMYNMRSRTDSTPDLGKITFQDSEQPQAIETDLDSGLRRPAGTSVLSDSVILDKTESSHNKKNRPKFAHLLNRTMSTRGDQGGRRSKPPTPVQTHIPDDGGRLGPGAPTEDVGGLRTAPLQQSDRDRSLREMMTSTIRNRSVDRQPSSMNSSDATITRSTKDHLISNIKSKSGKAADGFGKASKFLGKITRSGSSNEREKPDDEPYVFKVINKPLVEQTRITRIAKRLEHSKDKTEFWMPALPWRCIEYVGCPAPLSYPLPEEPRIRRLSRLLLKADFSIVTSISAAVKRKGFIAFLGQVIRLRTGSNASTENTTLTSSTSQISTTSTSSAACSKLGFATSRAKSSQKVFRPKLVSNVRELQKSLNC